MKFNSYFSREEFECKCGCGQNTVDAGLILQLTLIRERFNKPVIVTSGNRCMAYNERVGGSRNSQHLLGRAADIIVKDVDPDDVADYAEKINVDGGVGRYSTFTHVDSRCGFARWSD